MKVSSRAKVGIIAALAVMIPLIPYGIVVTMIVLWCLSLTASIMFHLALTKGVGREGMLLSWLVAAGRENGLSEPEVYKRGRTVSVIAFLVIPFLPL